MSMNPYESPQGSPFREREELPLGPAARMAGLVHHVRIVSVLMIVQSCLELLMGGVYLVMGAVVPMALRSGAILNSAMPPGGPSPDLFVGIMLATYLGIGLVHLVAGGLHAVAGLRNYRFKSRTLGVIALAGGLVTLMGCYCLPTSLALLIYGLIVYLNGPVSEAFQLGERGYAAGDILTTFART